MLRRHIGCLTEALPATVAGRAQVLDSRAAQDRSNTILVPVERRVGVVKALGEPVGSASRCSARPTPNSSAERRYTMLNRPADFDETLCRAIAHAVNYHGLDSRLNLPDYAVAELITPEVIKHLRGITDIQIYERMSPEERANRIEVKR